jgi:hypothetical protein
MASTELSRRAEKVVGYPPLCDMGDLQRRELPDDVWPSAVLRPTGLKNGGVGWR